MPYDGTNFERPEPDGLRRLRRLKVVVVATEDQRFYMRSYQKLDISCGTVGCALGWGAMDPDLIAEGLSLYCDYDTPRVSFAGLIGLHEAAPPFFSINTAMAHRLFSEQSYPDLGADRAATKAEFLRRLDAIIAEKEAAWLAEMTTAA